MYRLDCASTVKGQLLLRSCCVSTGRTLFPGHTVLPRFHMLEDHTLQGSERIRWGYSLVDDKRAKAGRTMAGSSACQGRSLLVQSETVQEAREIWRIDPCGK